MQPPAVCFLAMMARAAAQGRPARSQRSVCTRRAATIVEDPAKPGCGTDQTGQDRLSAAFASMGMIQRQDGETASKLLQLRSLRRQDPPHCRGGRS